MWVRVLAGYQAHQYIITSCSTAAQQHGADSDRVEVLIPTCTVMYLRQIRVLFLKLASVTMSHNLTINYDLQHWRHCGGGGSRFKMSTCLWSLQPSAAADSLSLWIMVWAATQWRDLESQWAYWNLLSVTPKPPWTWATWIQPKIFLQWVLYLSLKLSQLLTDTLFCFSECWSNAGNNVCIVSK